MCGIVGITANESVSSNIIGAMKKLEYRGYDSSGIAVIDENKEMITKELPKLCVDLSDKLYEKIMGEKKKEA